MKTAPPGNLFASYQIFFSSDDSTKSGESSRGECKFAPSPRRIVCRRCQSDPWRAASRILPDARLYVTKFLRTTGTGTPLCLVDSISRSPKPDRSLGTDGGERVDALKIENAIA